MKLLVDQNLAQRVAQLLCEAGHDAVHVAERGMQSSEDDEILRLALNEERVIVSEDSVQACASAASTACARR